ncbi:discoidin domain-containing protein [Aeromicrobium duanguangcaii]|uniref:discoidin domain-containing protein n=1 Tax=Aeromicrobium duanguangcaii TaxID=2968086 RepID=UPI0020170B87|nr:discoidin domain-containing protein [Aeromicrobium duanguangcaii]
MGRSIKALVVAVLGAVVVIAGGSGATAESGWWVATSTPSPESQINATGEPARGTDADGNVTGYIDAHTHMFMDLGMGGNAVCGSTWSEKGIADALKDCDRHGVSILENLTNEAAGRGILDKHDTVGWPTFTDWPTYSSFTHQQMYYKWVERAWRGGQRVMVNDMVSNPGLCPILGIVAGPNKYSCDDMDTVRRQIKATYDLQDFVDKQYGGAGKGWYRVVKTPEQARKVVADGKLAVVLGVEVSEPFGCKQVLGAPRCTKADIDKGLDELKGKGVSSMFLCHKFDNALCGVRYDESTAGLLVNAGQFLTTGTWWNPTTCKEGQIADNTVIGGVLPSEIAAVPGLPAVLPIYPKGPHCNPRGLTELGEYALRGMIKRNMIVELDHMSAKAAGRALDILEAEAYPGAVSSHDWMAEPYMDRLYALGGFASQYGHTATEFAAQWKETKPLREKYGVAYGYGTDMNGFGGTAAPPADAAKISYPFTGRDGTVFERQVTGDRTWDYNAEGVPHYGLVPDWIESLRVLEGSAIVDDLAAGSESYLRTWGATADFAPGANLASGSIASASSTERNLLKDLKPGNAIDGKTSTRWASRWGQDDAWLQVEFLSARQVGKVTIEWEQAHARQYRVQTSLDGKWWRDVAIVGTGDGGLDTVRLERPVSARFVRVQGVERATKYGYSVKELGVFS